MKILIYIGVGIVILILILFLVKFITVSEYSRLREKFFAAIRSGDLESVKKLLTKKSITVNFKDRDYLTPLAIAASQGDIEMARLLTDNNADVNSTAGQDDFPVLMFAAAEGQTGMVKFLIDRGADVKAVAYTRSSDRSKMGITALMAASAEGNSQSVELLIDKGADVDAKAAWEITTPRTAHTQHSANVARMSGLNAMQTSDYIVEQALKEYPAETFFKPPLLLAIENGNSDIVKILVEKGADPTWVFEPKDPADWTPPMSHGMNAVMYAAYRGEAKAIELLISKGWDMNVWDYNTVEGKTALMYAAQQGEAEAVRLLVNKGADINVRNRENYSALEYAFLAGSAKAVKVLVDSGAEKLMTKDEQTMLMLAAKAGHNDIIDVLIESRSDIEARDKKGLTALMYAAGYGHIDTVKNLVDKGANINAKSNTGLTILMNTAIFGHIDIVKYLVDKGANIGAKDENGLTALTHTSKVQHPSVAIIKFLVEQGADVMNGADLDARSIYGPTALILASEEGQTETVRLLIEKGADINAQGKRGDTKLTALMEAAWFGHAETVKLLIEKGADVNIRNRNDRNGYESALNWALEEGQYLIDSEKVRLKVESYKSVPPRSAEDKASDISKRVLQSSFMRGMQAQRFLGIVTNNGFDVADIFLEKEDERTARYQEIVKMLKAAGARED